MPYRDREYVRMFVVHRARGESYKEIAEMIPRSVSTLRRWAKEFSIEIEDMKNGRE